MTGALPTSGLVSVETTGSGSLADSDQDGLTDRWETDWFGDITAKDGSADSDADGIPELVLHDETGLVHRVDDREGFTADVARLLADPGLRGRLGRAGLSRVEAGFAEEVVMDRVEACLCEWASPSRPLAIPPDHR